MRLRSLLFVPGDSERKFARARESSADALILDLEDSVAVSEKAAARAHVAGLIEPAVNRAWMCMVRVNALDTGLTLEDLAAVVNPGLDALLIPKVNGAADVERIGHYLDALEAKAGMAAGSVKLAIVATETAKAMFALASYAPANPRLIALTWGAEDLAAALGATDNKEPDGAWTSPYQLARAQCLFAASAAEVAAIDTVYTDFRDSEGLERDCRRSRRDGFIGRMAIHPDQVGPINRAYAPTEAEITHARKLVAAFEANPGAGALAMDGKMVDLPHLKAARKILGSI
jgi:citrate lyase subunit beta / citryl-CoA lyase